MDPAIRHMIPYFVLPIGMQNIEDPEQFESKTNEQSDDCTTFVKSTKLQVIEGKKYPDINLVREGYIRGKILPYFQGRETIRCDFGCGAKKIDPLIKFDIYRMPWTIQSNTLPKELTKTEEGLKLVLKWMFDIAGNDDNLLLTITQIFNQRIGIDLFHFVFETINDGMPDRYLPSERTDKRRYSLYKKNGNIYINCQIFGKIRDLAQEGKFLPVKFTAICRCNLITDRSIQVVRFFNLCK